MSNTTAPKTSSIAPTARPTCEIHSTAVVADKALLSGSHIIKIGANSIIQPYAKLSANGGTITIGANVTIAEAVVLETPSDSATVIEIGDNVCLESSAHITGACIGEGTEIGIQAIVDSGARIGKFCKIAPKQHIKGGEILEDYTIVYGSNERRQNTGMIANQSLQNARVKAQAMHTEALKKLIPNASAKWAST